MRILLLLLLSIGWMISGYLLLRHFELTTSSGPVAPSACRIVFQADCDAALQSPISTWLGLPLAGWGIVYYGTLAVLVLLAWVLGEWLRTEANLLAFLLSVVGAIGSIALLVVMAMGITAFCPLCLLVHLVNLALVPILGRLSHFAPRLFGKDFPGGRETQATTGMITPVAALKIMALVCVFLTTAVIGQWIYGQTLRYPPYQKDVRHAVAAFAMKSRLDIPLADDDPRIGEKDAEVQLIVFSDFHCAACRQFAKELNQIRDEFKGKLTIVFKHFPLDMKCNAAMKTDLHPGACETARLAEAAHRQGKFWEFHDMVFESGNLTSLGPEWLAQQLHVELDQWKADTQNDEPLGTKIARDIDLGIRLGVDETPTVFIGGRRAPDIQKETIRFLIHSELANRSVLPVPPHTKKIEVRAGNPSGVEASE